MAKRNAPTWEDIRKAYIEDFLKRMSDAEAFAILTETKLADFIRQFDDPDFSGVYECLDHNFYDRVRNKIATNQKMASLDEENGLLYSELLKQYSLFLESKAFKNLFKNKINVETQIGIESGQTSAHAETPIPQFREESEGERKHVTKEMEVIRRNPHLRQQCIDKYGYQCQCCGMDFAEMYGEDLGANFIEVHHLQPISTFETDGVPENFADNLVPLCSNCHSMIHHIKDSVHPLRDLREAYRGEKKVIKICKED